MSEETKYHVLIFRILRKVRGPHFENTFALRCGVASPPPPPKLWDINHF
jgi:hypothetical protein